MRPIRNCFKWGITYWQAKGHLIVALVFLLFALLLNVGVTKYSDAKQAQGDLAGSKIVASVSGQSRSSVELNKEFRMLINLVVVIFVCLLCFYVLMFSRNKFRKPGKEPITTNLF